MRYIFLILAILCIISGIGLIYWVNRRRFYKRNVAGLETFSCYESSLLTRFLERLGKWLAYALIILSIPLWGIYSSEKKRIERKQQKIENSTLEISNK
ncbi:hypothetical protein HMPREF9714_01436 [Myroides odoratimimus CCUG 12901]|uniref:hypothetical protein n=1 Tax=Myroides odoratimimus TaxID=76832 RepID=UPI000246094E|nr:hypothetical protein [Myroides odoratimimus]EHO11007.1 hypothetical protein HMPREF9714_01436 [Myroides odoratimimus CCUG 12901]MDM1412422.1 hypothetical protein [Myroides odoratimimus]